MFDVLTPRQRQQFNQNTDNVNTSKEHTLALAS